MKAIPTDDPLFGKGSIRRDGRKLHPMYLFDVKTEAELNGPWDAFKLVRMISAEDSSARSHKEDACSPIEAMVSHLHRGSKEKTALFSGFLDAPRISTLIRGAALCC